MSQSSSPLFTPPVSPINSEVDVETATLEGPAIPGLYYFVDVFNSEEAEGIIEEIIKQGYFDVEQGRDQAVLFGSRGRTQNSGLPQWARKFLSFVASRLTELGALPTEIFQLLFPLTTTGESNEQGTNYTRQLILNCYQPGQGIASHVDLPHKFLDGIMIFSFGSGIAMKFEDVQRRSTKHSIYLLPCSLCVLSGESRWQWSHGISEREGDHVWYDNKEAKRYIKRGQRLSITVRWYQLEGNENEHNQEAVDQNMKDSHKNNQNGRESKDTGKVEGSSTDARLTASSNK